MTSNEVILDVFFNVLGHSVPADHGYALFGAVSRCLEAENDRWMHENPQVGLHLIRGTYIPGKGNLILNPPARMGLRLPVSLLTKTMKLAGKAIAINGCRLRIGVCHSTALVPATALYAHIVTTKNGDDAERFDKEIRRQLDAADIKGKFERMPDSPDNKGHPTSRRIFRIGNKKKGYKRIVGHSVLVTELTAEESIRLQENGLGGRRRMGCGVFLPMGKEDKP